MMDIIKYSSLKEVNVLQSVVRTQVRLCKKVIAYACLDYAELGVNVSQSVVRTQERLCK